VLCAFCGKKVSRHEAFFIGGKAFCSLYHGELFEQKEVRTKAKKLKAERERKAQKPLYIFLDSEVRT